MALSEIHGLAFKHGHLVPDGLFDTLPVLLVGSVSGDGQFEPMLGIFDAADMAANKKFVRISRKSFEVANKPLLSCFS